MRGTSLVATLIVGGALLAQASPSTDPLTAEVESWSAFLRDDRSADEMAKQVKEGATTGLARIQQALRDGRRYLALLRMSSVANDIAALRYLKERTPDQRKEVAAFEAEWTRLGGVLAPSLGPSSPPAFDHVRPAALRAIGEASLPQVGVFYHASVEYGRSTTPDSGLYYLGAAQGQRDFGALVGRLASPTALAAPAVRGLAGELEDLQDDLLAAYRPPASVDRHREFIVANSTLKEARELQGAGLRYGALLRYLQAAVRVAPLRQDAPAVDATIPGRLQVLETRLTQDGVDYSIGRLLLEWAQADLAEHATDGQAAIAAAIAGDALPRYFAALEPERARPVRPQPSVAVTLVRWPYT
jgi:hypothetical protein